MKHSETPFTGLALSGFCMQISILLKSAVPLFEGLSIMAEDAANAHEKEILEQMAKRLRLGVPFHEALKETESFPSYVEHMAMLGERTGRLDSTMEQLAVYYEKEYHLAEDLRKAVTYPAMMIFMLLIILFILFTKVMPVFSGVYEQLGTSIPPAAAAAIRLGGIISGAALILCIALLAAAVLLWLLGKNDSASNAALFCIKKLKSHSKLSASAASRRFCSVMAIALQCGMKLEEAFDTARTLADHPSMEAKIDQCRQSIAAGKSFYDSICEAKLFSGFELQMVRIGSRAGQLDRIMEQLAEEYDRKITEQIDTLIARLEPTIVSILAVAVGLVLLAVMLPLAGILSSIG